MSGLDIVLPEDDCTRHRVERSPGQTGRHLVECLAVGAGDEQRVAAGGDALGDGGNLVGRLAGAEDHLRESLAEGAVVIDAREPQILEGKFPEETGEPALGLGKVELAGLNLLEERAKRRMRHGEGALVVD